MSDLVERIELLSKERRELLDLLLAEDQDRQAGREGEGFQLPPVTPAPGERHVPFPLTDVQRAYWLGQNENFELGNVACHSYMEFEPENLDVERFGLAWQRLIERHDMLRAIVLPDGRQQVLEYTPPYSIEVLDLRGQEPEQAASRLEAIRQRMSHQILPTDRWPLFELRASRLDEGRVRLHLSLDHLVADAGSLWIIIRELDRFYQDSDAALPPLAFSFRDYVLAEVALQDSEMYRRARDYWVDRLPTLPPAPELPLAKSPSAVTYPRFVRRSAHLEPPAWLRLKTRAARSELTPSGVLLTAYAEVLATWSKAPRFALNLTLFNRLPVHPQVNEVMGDFTSLTLLAVDNSAHETFDARAQRLQKQLWDDLDHPYFSGVRVMWEMGRVQGGASAAAMPVVFTSALGLGPSRQESSVMGNATYSISQTPQVWLDHQVSESATGALDFNWDAVEELFPHGLLDDMFDAYCRLLHRLADEETAWQSLLELAPPAQLAQRAAVNATDAPVSEALLQDLFAAQVAARAGHRAVVSSRRTLTYEELYRRANQVGRRLREMGARPNQLVGVVMDKGWEQVVAVLGVLVSGAAYLPIDPALPTERLWYLLENGQVELALTQPWLDESLEWPAGVQRLRVEDAAWAGVDEGPLAAVQGPQDLAYVIFTSGSTGQPKGVMIDHRGAVNTILDINRRFGVGPEDRVLALSALNFDLSVYDIFGLLAAGGLVVMPDAGTTRDPAHWAEWLRREQVTLWDTVPALMEMLVEHVGGRGEALPASLRLALLSGDWVPLTLPERIEALASGEVQVISLGGATEASIWSILYPIERVEPTWKSIPYGRPMVNQRFHVLNEWLSPCPVWTPGQLYIGGLGLAQGYWRDEAKTQASFFCHPRTGERLYRTGDLGRYLPDGNIEFLGREDLQVKVRGHRIELGEIEAALEQHPGVQNGVVVAVGEPRGDKYLVAYVVPEGKENGPTAADIRGYLKEKLPEYMVPPAFVFLDELPLTSNGKVNRKALPAPDQVRLEQERPFEAPRNPLEEVLVGICSELLGVEQVGIHDNFFELGGNSLLAASLASRILNTFQVELLLPSLFEMPTVAGLAQAIEEALQAGPSAADTAVTPGDFEQGQL